MDVESVRVAVLCLALATALVLLFVSDRLEIGEQGRRKSGGPWPEVEWNKTYGSFAWDEARSVVQTRDGGYALAGAGQFFWLVKTSSRGELEWNRSYGWGMAYSVIQTRDGGYGLVGGGSGISGC